MSDAVPPPTLRRSPDVLSRVLDGDTVLVHLESGTYFGLDEVGTHVWARLEEAATLDDLVAVVTAAFEVDAPRAREDLEKLLDELEEQALIVRDAPRS